MVEIEMAVIEDLGGEIELSEVQLILIRDLAFAATMRDLLAEHLAATGPLTKAGKRKAALGAWHQASARVEGLARRIGTQRRPAKVPSVEEYVRQRAAELRGEHPAPGPSPGPVPLPGIGLASIPERELHPDEVSP